MISESFRNQYPDNMPEDLLMIARKMRSRECFSVPIEDILSLNKYLAERALNTKDRDSWIDTWSDIQRLYAELFPAAKN